MSKPNKFPFKDYFDNYSEYQLNQVTNSILKMLIQPYTDFEAYDLGIINAKGEELKPYHSTPREQRKYYSRIVRLCITLKKIIDRYPRERIKFRTYYVALQNIDQMLEDKNLIKKFEEDLGTTTASVASPTLPLRIKKDDNY